MNNSDRILAYLENTLSQSERAALEGEILKDPGLKTELDLQSEIIKGIQELRKAELKQMLNNVPVGGGNIASSITGTQYFAAAVTTALIGAGTYFMWPENTDIEAQAASNLIESVEPEIAEAPENNAEVLSVPEENKKDLETTSVVPKNLAETSSVAEEKKADIVEETETVAIPEENIALVRPEIIESFEDEKQPSDIKLPENNLLEKAPSESTLIVETENKFKEFNFHYQVKNNKLLLYGNFEDTYEIIDLIKGSKRTPYLYYQGKYYPVNLNQATIVQLSEVSENNIIEQLDNLRTKR